MNLVMNARDAMPKGGTITIETTSVDIDKARAAELRVDGAGAGALSPGPHARLRVQDTGVGMDAETIAKIFDPFFTTKVTGQGTGLGLATVYGIVHQSGGAIAVASAPGRGTHLDIYLPCLPRASSEAGASVLPAAVLPAGASFPAAAPPLCVERATTPAAAGTILVVEDQPRLREVIGVVLRELGYDVLVAEDAKAALRITEHHAGPIDLLLTDVVMPQMSGPRLAEILRGLRPEVRVMYMSGYAPDAITGHGGMRGEPLLAKPFGPDELRDAVRAALAKRPASAATMAADVPPGD
jgi:CheY-like chemotaxis protein